MGRKILRTSCQIQYQKQQEQKRRDKNDLQIFLRRFLFFTEEEIERILYVMIEPNLYNFYRKMQNSLFLKRLDIPEYRIEMAQTILFNTNIVVDGICSGCWVTSKCNKLRCGEHNEYTKSIGVQESEASAPPMNYI